jgi:hypothetical protein
MEPTPNAGRARRRQPGDALDSHRFAGHADRQLAKTETINKVTVTRGGTGSYGYSVQASTDGTNWTTVGTSPSNSTGTDTITFSPTQAQYVRLRFPGGAGAATPQIDEVAVTAP